MDSEQQRHIASRDARIALLSTVRCETVHSLLEVYKKHPRLFTIDEYAAMKIDARKCRMTAASDIDSGR